MGTPNIERRRLISRLVSRLSPFPPFFSKIKIIAYGFLALSASFLDNVLTVQAQINLTDIPDRMASQMGIPVFAAELLCSAILILMFVLPIALIARKKKANAWLAELMMGFVVLCVCVALEWMPYWIVLMLCLFVAALYAGLARGAFGGRGE